MTQLDFENNLDKQGLRVADHVSAMLAYWDNNLVCRFANDAYRQWFGKTREEMVNKMTLDQLLGPLFEMNRKYIDGVLAGKPQTFEREIPLFTGEKRYSLASYYPDTENGIVKGFYVHVADITSIKQLEIELHKANEIVSAQNNRLMNFANITTHNLKSYAGGFSGLTELLLLSKSKEEQAEIIGHLKSLSKNFTESINNLNAIVYAKDINTVECTELNLHNYVNKVISSLSMAIKECGATIHNNVKEHITCLGNPAYIESILTNFLTNAIKYKQTQQALVVNIDCLENDTEIRLSIADNGQGIDLEKHGKELFGMYKTFHGNPDAKGLGLYITNYQVAAMNGRIEVESKVNKGSTFIVYLKKK